MIKPHGSDTLNPLYVADDAKRAALQQEAAGLTSIVVQNFDLVNPVDIKVTFYSKTTGATKSFNDTLGAGAAKGYNTRTGGDTPGGQAFYEVLAYWDDIPTAANSNLGNWTDGYTLWGGSAVIEGDPGANIAAAVFNVKMRQATSAMFTSVSDADAANEAFAAPQTASRSAKARRVRRPSNGDPVS